jgi:DNA processing protein
MSSKRNGNHDRGNGLAAPPALDPEQLVALLQLRMLRVPDAALNKLLPRHAPVALARRFCRHRITDTIERRVAASLRELQRLQVGVTTVADPGYPEKLHELDDEKPPILFRRGKWDLVETRIVAIVGTRRSTEYGNGVAESLAADLTRYDLTIISGLALGIDARAHLGALEAGGSTIAVLGCGIDVLYPQRNARLQERIATDGLLISEFAPGEPALKHHFLQRNRLIAKLAGAVIVVEAGMKSGSHNTVKWALNHGVTVFAVPGPIGREASMGTNTMILDGATMITSVRDVVEQLPWRVTPVATSPQPATGTHQPSANGASVFGVMGPVAMQIDQIARAARCDTSTALATLAELELDGLVRQLPGKRFVRVEPPTGRRVLERP